MVTAADRARYLANWQDEIDSASLYRTIAASEPQPQLAEVYARLAETEAEHAAFWAEKAETAGGTLPPERPSWRARTLGWLARRFGPNLILPTLTAAENAGRSSYLGQPEVAGTTLPADERSHATLLRTIDATGGVEGSTLARLEGRHRSASGNALRAAVLGANDGLVSNLSLVMGVAGAALSGSAILITGLAGLLAGAGSMAMGEWLSVQSSRELYQRQIDIEAEELRTVPAEEAEELALIYQAKGLPEEQARHLADRLVSDEQTALDTLAREELGINPEELGGSAWEAAATSFVLFALGAIVPVAPFAFLSGTTAVVTSLGLSAVALFAIGAAITLLTGRSLLYSGGRQVLIGLAAAALTFGVGTLIGVSLAG
ncbi:VIT1/CCC1 family protein [Haladaptatus sp. DYSN1]|uniref:VIT1/CCC1 transporter family protein n=1 Tax=unclassified Haladaptatus TaxID=2622732 RepID=UPI002404AC08|nr:VIT1/CCC1 family protein [Haladaptatus sp. DYSN1]